MLVSGFSSIRGPGAPMLGIVATSSGTVLAWNFALMRWILDAPKFAM